jgi:polysaccharide biosynthesis protein PslH
LEILLVTSRYPWPARRGDQIRTRQTLELLAPEHRVTLLTPRPAGGQPPLRPFSGLEVLTYRPGAGPAKWLGVAGAAVRGLPLQSGLFVSSDLRRQLRHLAPRFDLAILQLVRLVACREDLGTTPVLVDLIDDLALNVRRRAGFDHPWRRPVLALEARLLDRAQRRLARRAAAVTLVCDRYRRELLDRLPPVLAGRVRVAGLAAPAGAPPAFLPLGAPTGAETGHEIEPALDLAAAAPLAPLKEGPPRLVFTGNLGYFVNADAIAWWLRDVWPALAARHPGLSLVVAGDRPAPAVRRAVALAAGRLVSPRGQQADSLRPALPPDRSRPPAAEVPRVSLLAPVPDLGLVLAGATAAIAPLRCGSGVPVKILEAWAAGVPVVASPWAAAGTTGIPGDDLYLADSPTQWLDALTRLLHDPQERARLAANGRRRLAADYSSATAKAQLLAAVAAAASGV